MRLKTLLVAATLGGMATLVPIAAAPAFAYTPGAPCRLEVSPGGFGHVDYPGTVGSDGNSCVPNAPFSGVLTPINAGLACGTTVSFSGIFVGAFC
jgi:hypothetical protein